MATAAPPAAAAAGGGRTLGHFLAARLAEAGAPCFFAVPGDYSLALLDEFAKEPRLPPLWCCNELNAGYAAEGCSRAAGGLGALVVTAGVGSLAALAAVAGAFAESRPVVCVVGGPNSNDLAAPHRALHHTLGGRGSSGGQLREARAFAEVTAAAVVVRAAADAAEQIDAALAAALARSKPVYIMICGNLAAATHPSFSAADAPPLARPPPPAPDPAALGRAVAAVAAFLDAKAAPVLVGGPLLRAAPGGAAAFVELVEASGCRWAYMSGAKGLLPESHPACLGCYFGPISTPRACGAAVESADGVLFAGAIFSDYATAGDALCFAPAAAAIAGQECVAVGGGAVYGGAPLGALLAALAARVRRRAPGALVERAPAFAAGAAAAADAPLTAAALYSQLEAALTPTSFVLAETGDAFFQALKLRLPAGARLELSQQWGAIGWAVPAALGAAAGAPARRVLALVGDGAFQVAAQEVSTMLRYNNSTGAGTDTGSAGSTGANNTNTPGINPILVVLNNGVYAIEQQIHDNPAYGYNVLNAWDYVAFVKALDAGRGRAFAARAATPAALAAALAAAAGEHAARVCVIEAVLTPEDVAPELREYGRRLAALTGRPPA